jgi:uncharacterized protein (DUF4213/DUF364 family)
MKILKALLETLPVEPVPVRKVLIGIHWVLVSSRFIGLASALVDEVPHGHSPVRDVGSLHLKSAQELARWVLSENLLEASIGMAALNSLINVDEGQAELINASEVIARESQGKNLAVVGHFPFVERMKPITKNCWVIEKQPREKDYPEEAAQELIPKADFIAITGTALINHSMETLLALCQPGSKVMVLGPSTPLSPELFKYGVSFISGSRVIDEDAAITTIQQGATFQQVKGVRLVTLSKGHYSWIS